MYTDMMLSLKLILVNRNLKFHGTGDGRVKVKWALHCTICRESLHNTGHILRTSIITRQVLASIVGADGMLTLKIKGDALHFTISNK